MIQTGDITRIGNILPNVISAASEVYTDIHTLDSRPTLSRYLSAAGISESIKSFVRGGKVKPLRPILNELRVLKSEDEVVQMRRVGQRSGRAFTESMRQNFTREKDLCSFLEYQFKVNDCDTSAFVPVVAGGPVSDGNPIRVCPS